MKIYMKTILQGWKIMRILRLILGTSIMVQGIVARDTITIILGGFKQISSIL